MAERLTDEKRKKIIADYVQCQNYSEVARNNGLSPSGVKKIVLTDVDSVEKCEQKANDNTQDTLTYMAEQHDTKKRILVKILEAMEKKATDVDMFTNIKDLATAYGIILDKELKFAEIQSAKDNKGEPIEIILKRE